MRRAGRALVVLLALASPAAAQTPDQPPVRRRQVSPPPVVATPPTAAPATPPPSPPVLRSAVHGLTQQPAVIGSSGGGQCRATCAEQRVACLAAPQGGDCDGGWTRCLSTCGGLGYSRLPPTPSPGRP